MAAKKKTEPEIPYAVKKAKVILKLASQRGWKPGEIEFLEPATIEALYDELHPAPVLAPAGLTLTGPIYNWVYPPRTNVAATYSLPTSSLSWSGLITGIA